MKTLLITGASKGIGLAVARMCLADNYRVVNLSRSPAPDAGIENHAIDLSSSSAESRLKSLLGKVLEKGEIVLVHNAAKLNSDTANNTSTDDFRDIMDINLIAPHTLNQLVIPFMQAGSSIIYIGSTLSEKAVANTYSYVVSKHAMIGMMRATCQDLAGSGIHTACVCPGFTDTEMLRDHVGKDQEVLSSIAAMSTFGRLVSPVEVATTIKFAAENPVINGAVIHANLGQIEN
ncbi:MAG: SDR family oxidoreductase [SAR86 cluster bacterium]|jgi:3-oxoacyl-[acyl-carrier protein] reductase|uniref:SDR family oxidoreductase n=1 Tax=SAR86 cluster bacterium TaxID=2030880 RepID=A0A972VXT6_9GAMM|nr:SDR family oxidoreductase [SAR86 cluster bacterium]|tara:strand:+ start:18753 stop:19451 length:699 start_codon:yes stop_codon:yes gene_type:complete